MSGPKDYLTKTPSEILELTKLGYLNGQFHTVSEESFEKYPKYEYGDIEGKNNLAKGCRNGNSYIILGRDRNHDLTSGFGGTKNLPASYAIDLVAGLASSHRSKGTALGQETITGKNFYTDAARVYISQRADLDTYFGITEGMKYKTDSKNGCSGIGIKADSVLINGRRNIKIRAGGAHGDSLPRGGEVMAHGENIPSAGNAPRIEFLIANMNPEPAVLGNKLVKKLSNMTDQLEELKSEVIALNTEMALLRMQLALHIHGDPISVLTLPSPDLAVAAAIKAPKLVNEIVVGIYNKFKGKIEQIASEDVPNNEDWILSKNVYIS